MDTTKVSLVLRNGDILSEPLVEVMAANHVLPDLLIAVSNLGKFLPIASIIDGQLVTGLTFTRECISVRGQSLGRLLR